MLRFLRKPWKSLRKSIPLEDTTHRTTDIGAEHRRDFEDEHCSRKIPAGRDDGTDMTMAPDVSREEGSRIANQDGSIEDQQLPALNTSTPTPVRQGDNTSERDRWCRFKLSLFFVSVALQGKGQIPSGSGEAQSKQLDPNAHDLQSIERGKFWCSCYTTVRIDHRQSRKEARSTGFLVVPHLSSTLRRDQPKHSVPSKPSWHPSQMSIPNIRFDFGVLPTAPL